MNKISAITWRKSKVGLKDLKNQPGYCPNHESEKRQADGEHQNVLRGLEKMSSQAVNMCVRNRDLSCHVRSRFWWSPPLLRSGTRRRHLEHRPTGILVGISMLLSGISRLTLSLATRLLSKVA